MAEKEVRLLMAQDTGNPVLDSVVNVLMARGGMTGQVEEIHKALLAVADKEPGGLKRRIGMRQAGGDQ
jgi:hypothetical protein